MNKELEKEELVILSKNYYGFEPCYDLPRDVSEIWDFPEDERFKKVKGEFNGTLKVLITFVPAKGDIE